MEYKDMLPHQCRVVDEMMELNSKINALSVFINESPVFKNLPPDEQMRLMNQNYHMTAYSDILEKRIEHFGG